MENKKNNTGLKVLLTILIILVVFTLCLVVMNSMGVLSFSSNTNDNKNNKYNENILDNTNTKINEELKNTISYVTKTNGQVAELVAIQNNGAEIKILDLTDYYYGSGVIGDINYIYEDERLYFSLFSCNNGNGKCYDENNKHELGYIDLTNGNGNYELNILTNLDGDNIKRVSQGFADYIAKIGDIIYFSNDNLYSYNINTKEITDMNISGNNRSIWLQNYNNSLIYNVFADIYILDTEINESKLLLENADISYVYKNKLVYNTSPKNINDSYIPGSYYLYDLDNNKTKELGNRVGISSIEYEYIVPFGDYYIYLNKDGVITHSDKGEILSCDTAENNSIDFDCNKYSVWSLTKSGNNRIIIKYTDKDEINGNLEPISIEYNIDTGEILDKKDSSYNYLNIIYID